MGRIAIRIATIGVMFLPGTGLGQPPTGGGMGNNANTSGPASIGKIGIGTIGPASLPADLRSRLEDATAAGLTASGATVVSAAEVARGRTTFSLGTCADPLCQRRLAQITDVRYWLRGTCQLDVSTYRLRLELVDAQSGASVAARDDTCDICTEADAADLANVAASTLKATLSRSLTGTAVVPAAREEMGKTAPLDSAEPSGTRKWETVPSRDDARPMWRTALGWGALGGAAAAVAGGVYYLAIDGKDINCLPNGRCLDFNDTKWRFGWPLIGLGAALATTGILLLALPVQSEASTSAETGRAMVGPRSPAGIVISPGGVAVVGRF